MISEHARDLGFDEDRLAGVGSMARGDAGPASDVDLLIELDRDANLGLFDLFDLRDELGAIFERPVSFAFRSEMRPWFRDWIEEDRIEIY